MLVPPLLSPSLLQSITSLIEKNQTDGVMALLKNFPLEEKVHYLRYFYHQSPDEHVPCIFTVWQACMPLDHPLNTEQYRHALYTAGMWWDVFKEQDQRRNPAYDTLEGMLEALGATDEGREFFRWVTLYPVGIQKWLNLSPSEMLIWDEHRRGAIICLARYAYKRSTEFFLARHLDDWNTIQIDVIELLAALRSRVLARLAPWYIQHDPSLKPILEAHGFDEGYSTCIQDGEKDYMYR